jgi:hypothetical protein
MGPMNATRLVGPSSYYVSDKNLFDALVNHKVDSEAIRELFLARNTIVSKLTRREDAASYFSRLVHDYFDHKEIAKRLGVVPRRERITSMSVVGKVDAASIVNAATELKNELEALGDTVNIKQQGNVVSVRVQYDSVDYRRSEFSQVQHKDGEIELIVMGDRSILRNTKNDYMDSARDSLLAKLAARISTGIKRNEISMFDIPVSKLRSRFFYDLANGLPGFVIRDITDVYVYKKDPSTPDKEFISDADTDTHVGRIFLRGRGVSRSEMLQELVNEDDYHIVRMSWHSKQTLGTGHTYEIEAVFEDSENCTGFSFIVNAVYPRDDESGRTLARRRAPQRDEVDAIARIIEQTAADVLEKIRAEFFPEDEDDDDASLENVHGNDEEAESTEKEGES